MAVFSTPSIVGVLVGGAIAYSVLLILALLDEVNKEAPKDDYENFRSLHTNVDSLIYALKDEDERVQGYAARALEEIKAPWSVEPLIATLKFDISVVECKYILRNIGILAEIGDKRAIEPLSEVAKKASDPGVRKVAHKAITKIKQTNQKAQQEKVPSEVITENTSDREKFYKEINIMLCTKCGVEIHPATFVRTKGLCMPCSKKSS